VPLEILCGSCGAVLYSGFELKGPKEVVRTSEGKCKKCGALLPGNEFSIEVAKVESV
jgi:hypothetical protein